MLWYTTTTVTKGERIKDRAQKGNAFGTQNRHAERWNKIERIQDRVHEGYRVTRLGRKITRRRGEVKERGSRTGFKRVTRLGRNITRRRGEVKERGSSSGFKRVTRLERKTKTEFCHWPGTDEQTNKQTTKLPGGAVDRVQKGNAFGTQIHQAERWSTEEGGGRGEKKQNLHPGGKSI